MRWLLFAVVVFIWAWSERPSAGRKPIVLSPPGYLVSDVEDAMEMWHQHCPGMFQLGAGGIRFRIVESLPAGHIGEHDGVLHEIRLVPQNLLIPTIAHEIGHAASLGHGPGGIMNEYVTGEGITAADIANASNHGWVCR